MRIKGKNKIKLIIIKKDRKDWVNYIFIIYNYCFFFDYIVYFFKFYFYFLNNEYSLSF